MDYVKRILGEADDEPDDQPEKPPVELERGSAAKTSPEAAAEPHEYEAEISELANLWTLGNRNEVADRFMEMDNETAVKLVFAIGEEGALELARMADEMLEQSSAAEPDAAQAEIDDPPFAGNTLEIVEPGPKQTDSVQRILGKQEAA